MCPNGCAVSPETHKCKTCGKPLKTIMELLQVPLADQNHTINWLIYKHYQ